MRVLGIESSSLVASVALVTDDILTAEYTVDFKKTHSQTLLPMLDEIMNMLGLEMDTVDAIAVAAGPGCNLLLWALLSSVGGEALDPFAGAHLILGALNLLPVRPMDGGRLLWLLTALCTEPYTADRVAYAVGAVASAALLVLCLYLTLTTGAGLFLLPGVLWLAVKGVLPNGAKPDKINCYKK